MIAEALSDSRKAITPASASGVTQRPKSASGMSARFAGVSMIEGSTAFTRTPLSLYSSASASVSRITPALLAA